MNLEVRRHSPLQPWTYELLDRRQREIAETIPDGGAPILLLSEVAPVITRGRRTPDQDLTRPKGEIAGSEHLSQTPVLDIDRGGLATYHGPGQWVVFPVHAIATTTRDPRGIRKIIYKLLEIAAHVGQHYSSPIEIQSGERLGVWNSAGKFAAAGVHIQNGILLHGLAINGFQTPQSFQGLRPCGLDLPVSYLLKEPNETEFLKLKELIIEAVRSIFPSPFESTS